jgi:hypothetical protein
VTVPVRNPLKDDLGRFVPGAMFSNEIRAGLADPATDDARRTALKRELLHRPGEGLTAALEPSVMP